ncbi:hypothetical protein ACS2QR_27235, partial [Bacillus cereus group sp. Bce026]|uniref:hypothetical protein n=1 Tax=Bacillus cereus group sp. Bce026 TaxID=3445242 RepID=UPI003F28AB4D
PYLIICIQNKKSPDLGPFYFFSAYYGRTTSIIIGFLFSRAYSEKTLRVLYRFIYLAERTPKNSSRLCGYCSIF